LKVLLLFCSSFELLKNLFTKKCNGTFQKILLQILLKKFVFVFFSNLFDPLFS
jgi:hypothetical protein